MIQLTLRSARLNQKLTVREVSKKTGIPKSTLSRWEKNSGICRFVDFLKLLELYRIQSTEHIYIGKESDYERELLSRLLDSKKGEAKYDFGRTSKNVVA